MATQERGNHQGERRRPFRRDKIARGRPMVQPWCARCQGRALILRLLGVNLECPHAGL
jgi:hypothetical protein